MAYGFEKGLQFGDGVTTTRVTNVSNQYGPRGTEGAAGVLQSAGAYREFSVEITGETLNNSPVGLDLVLPIVPAGSSVVSVIAKVSEAFVLGGTTPAIEFGTDGSESTNGFTVTEAQAEATGTYDLTSALSGTWANPLAAATTVNVDLTGTSPTSTNAGKMEVVVRYGKV